VHYGNVYSHFNIPFIQARCPYFKVDMHITPAQIATQLLSVHIEHLAKLLTIGALASSPGHSPPPAWGRGYRRACAARVTVLGLRASVCVCVCLSPLILALQGPSRLISDTNGSNATRARKVMWQFCLNGSIRETWH